jgi:DNA-directed RNA polymerase subunit RPC12/RpoP
MPRIRICSQCGQETEYEYDDSEWEDRNYECEQCEQENEEEELLVLDII